MDKDTQYFAYFIQHPLGYQLKIWRHACASACT